MDVFVRKRIEEDKETLRVVSGECGIHEETLRRFCKKHQIKRQRTGPRSGDRHPDWKGGKVIDKSGYVLVYCPDHPYARSRGKTMKPIYVLEHRLVMEKHLGRYLLPKEVVHHLNGIKHDNRIENLEVYSSNSLHLKEELKGRNPKWSNLGKLNIHLGILKRCIRLALERGDQELPEKTLQKITSLRKDHPHLSQKACELVLQLDHLILKNKREMKKKYP